MNDPAWLNDFLIVDLGDEATVYASALLAELGARVVRVESAEDPLRRPGAAAVDATANAGKHSLIVDFDDPTSWSALRGAAEGIDVVIGPMSPTHPAHGLIEALSEMGVPVVDTVFRRAAPDEVATDLIVEAASGQMWLNGGPENPPAHPAGDLGYKQTSLAVAEAALALALGRRRTGHAGRVVVSSQEATALTTFQTANGNFWHWHGEAPGRHRKPADGTTVLSADGFWTSFTIHGPNWPRFVDWVGEVLGPQGIEGPEWIDSEHAVTNRHVVMDVSSRLAAALTQAELLREGQARGLLLLPVQDLGQVANDHHLAARDFWESVVHPASGGSDAAVLTLPGSPFRSNHGRSIRGPAPSLGEGGGPVLAAATAVPVGTDSIDPCQPLAGIRVVDFCWAIAGPLTTRLLAGLGAEVLKVESQNGLDTIRYIGVQPEGVSSWDTNGVFQDTSPNKKAVTINVNTEEGREVARQLIATADVVTANYTADRMDRWGLGAAELEKIKPDLITVNMAVMGTHGPNKHWRSYGSGIVAACGLAAHTGPPDRLPECLGTLHTDFTVPYFAALQILAALYQHSQTGRGAHIELAQYETAVRLMDAELTSVLNGEPVPERNGNRSLTMAPHGAFPSVGDDRWLAIACRHEDDWAALRRLVPNLEGLDRWADLDEVERRLSAWTATHDAWDAAAELQRAGIPASPVEDLRDHFERDPSMSGAWKELDLTGGLSGVSFHEPLLWDGERLPLEPSPQWSEHTFAILVEELGMTPEVFVDLIEREILW